MANQAPSDPTQGSVFTNLLKSLAGLQTPVCTEDGRHATAHLAYGRCLTCPQCESANQLFRLKKDLGYIQDSLDKLSRFSQDIDEHLTSALDRRRHLSSNSDDTSRLLVGPDITEIVSAVTHLKFQLPVSYYPFRENRIETPTTRAQEQQKMAPSDPLAKAYTNLGDNHKKCLWCFVVFPEETKIKKRVLINWWAAERWLENSTAAGGAVEQAGEDLLELLEQKQLIKRVEREGRPSDVWWMETAVWSFVKSTADHRSTRSLDETTLLDPSRQIGVSPNLELLRTIINVNGIKVELEAEHLVAMKDLQVLHLGRLQALVRKPGIQAKDFNFMKGFRKMKQLRLLSLQGIISLRNLPSSVCELRELMVLDLRACQALESLPSKLGDLKNLTHLDLSSACFDLLQMPIGIASLTNLEVLKGFVVNQRKPRFQRKSCSLHDLRKLKSLQSLSIFVSNEGLLQPSDIMDLFHIDELLKLKIVWKPVAEAEPGAAELPEESCYPCAGCWFKDQEQGNTNINVAEKLKKLDLWCVPESAARVLLDPARFPELEKLYARGLKMKSLKCDHAEQADKWINAKTLRLLFLPNFDMESEDLKNLFPNLSYLEYKSCPNFTFPDSNEGVWKDGR